jgi:hypothetical protein
MKPEKQNLIHDLLDDESRRETILIAGAKILRRRRQRRATRQVFALLILAGLAMWAVGQNNHRQAPVQIAAPAAKSSVPLHAQSLTDDQLLGLFPNTPVGLATLPNGKKMLIFPHPGDEAKFMTRL